MQDVAPCKSRQRQVTITLYMGREIIERSFHHVYQSKKSVALLNLVCAAALWLTVWKLNRQGRVE